MKRAKNVRRRIYDDDDDDDAYMMMMMMTYDNKDTGGIVSV
jgi:hypothetical protein